MSDERDQPPPQPAADPAAAGYEDRPANILGGIFLIGCGLCLLLVGGGCTGLLIVMLMGSSGGSGGLSMLVVSIAIAAGGIFAIVQGIGMARGRSGR